MALFPSSRKPCLLAPCKLQNSQQHWSDRPEFAFPPVARKLAPWCLAWPPGCGLRGPPLGRIQGGRESRNLQNSEPAGHRQPLWNVRSWLSITYRAAWLKYLLVVPFRESLPTSDLGHRLHSLLNESVIPEKQFSWEMTITSEVFELKCVKFWLNGPASFTFVRLLFHGLFSLQAVWAVLPLGLQICSPSSVWVQPRASHFPTWGPVVTSSWCWELIAPSRWFFVITETSILEVWMLASLSLQRFLHSSLPSPPHRLTLCSGLNFPPKFWGLHTADVSPPNSSHQF